MSNAFDAITEFEQELARYTGATHAVMTDCCTHALELCFIAKRIRRVKFTSYTYLSIPMLMHKINIEYELVPEKWTGEYRFYGTDIWDSARALHANMYRPGQIQCLSFGYGKPLTLGRGGAILLDDAELYEKLKLMCYDGRDLTISPWHEQKEFVLGYHYKPTPEEARAGLEKLGTHDDQPKYHQYPDLREITITTSTS